MKIIIPTKALIAALATLKPIAKPSTTYPILSNVHIKTSEDEITLVAMDGTQQLSITIPATVKRQGSTTLSCAKLHDSLASMPRPQQTTIDTNVNHESTITDGTASMKLRGLDPAEMIQPVIMDAKPKSLTISAEILKSLLTKALVHSSQDETRAFLVSVILIGRDGKLCIEAADGRRELLCKTDVDFAGKDYYIIPKDSVPSMAIQTEGDVELQLCDNALAVKSDAMEFRTKLIEWRLPDLMGAIPSERPLAITVNREELIGVVKYAQQQSSKEFYMVTINCDGKAITVCGVESKGKESDDFMNMNEDSVIVEKGSSTIPAISLNPQYFIDGLKAFTGTDVKIEIVNERLPIVIAQEGMIFAQCPIASKP